ncbi:alpha/beta fold hydrolase [Nocardia mangyaensis]|uniref:alpha/beta fold hydrolase n=1 Tax=Nocardia mangyaensis TaxID=2213200 RepID=UPI002676812F|nr:alpha/beta hydrolase [Nocardia mangyaensis]MDO3649888.1 alpha/beta hydrolase [Nocardia mangyaensis]
MNGIRSITAVLVAVGLGAGVLSAPASAADTPTVVLVHGAFADTTSWDGVAANLRADGYRVVVPDNPLRGPANDAAAVERVIAEIDGPIVLVGHSYGGAVITNVEDPDVTALVYIAGIAPEQGEPAQLLLDPIRFPGSRLLPPVLQLAVVEDPQGIDGKNLDGYVDPASFHEVFAPDVSDATAADMIAHQRSIAVAANIEPSGPAAWTRLPSWYLVSGADQVIPPASQRFMADRIGATTTEIPASHASLVSRPEAVAAVITAAATS